MVKVLALNFKNLPVRRLGLFQSTRNEIVREVNGLHSSKDRVLKFHQITQNNKPFIIVDKAQSVAMLYSQGQLQKTVPVGVGRTGGDSLNTVTYDFKNNIFGTTGLTTPSGQFSLKPVGNNCVNRSSYQRSNRINAVLLDGVQHPADYAINSSLALHQIPNEEMASRLSLFSVSGRRGMSTGCINFKPKDYEELMKGVDAKTPVYILPEECGNTLELVTAPNSRLWFRTNYANPEQNNIFELAMNKYFKKG